MAGGFRTVEKLGSMTPEELEEIEGIDPDMVERIQQAVNSYYGQFEGAVGESAEAARSRRSREAAPVEARS